MLSDLGSWASIIGLIISFVLGFSVCRFNMKKNNQENKHSSLFHKGTSTQSNTRNK